MIFLDRVGGGGRANDEAASLAATEAAAEDNRLRALTVSLGCIGKGLLGDVVDTGDSGVPIFLPRPLVVLWFLSSALLMRRAGCAWLMAGSGSSKVICREDSCLAPSLPLMSVDGAGVGGSAVDGIVVCVCVCVLDDGCSSTG